MKPSLLCPAVFFVLPSRDDQTINKKSWFDIFIIFNAFSPTPEIYKHKAKSAVFSLGSLEEFYFCLFYSHKFFKKSDNISSSHYLQLFLVSKRRWPWNSGWKNSWLFL